MMAEVRTKLAAPPALGNWLATLARLVLGVVWIAAGLAKITDLAASVRAVRAYRLLPELGAQLVGAGLPAVELLLGVLLLLGAGIRAGGVLSSVLLLAFIVGVASAWARGLRIDCGCFGSGGELAEGTEPSYGLELARDGALLLLAVSLARWPIGYLTIDGLLTSRREGNDHDSSKSGPAASACDEYAAWPLLGNAHRRAGGAVIRRRRGLRRVSR